MLSSMVKEHQTRQQIHREEQERRRKEALQSSSNLTNALVDHLNVGVAQAYLNQKRLDGEARRLEQSAAVLQKQTQHWITLVNGFCSAMKQVGDVSSWTQVIHKDVATVAATLQHAYTTTYNRTHATNHLPCSTGLQAANGHQSLGGTLALPGGPTVVRHSGVDTKPGNGNKSNTEPMSQDTVFPCDGGDKDLSNQGHGGLASSSSTDTVVEVEVHDSEDRESLMKRTGANK